jgi:serine/threonine protein kinase/tetratricopeptide (TPR) repeat protein
MSRTGGPSLLQSPRDMIGTTLGRYRILARLGEGGMGTVYRALDERLEREVAVKVLRGDLLRDDAARRRLRHEARALSRLNHPGIATLFDFDAQDGVDYLVLEFVPGETLATTLAAGPLPEARARAVALGIAEALEAAHEQDIVHRDLKPGNVMITPRGRVKVLDFGLAHRMVGGAESTASLTAGPEALAGTLPYMAPEQISGGTIDPRTDLYALGAVLFEMISGQPLVSGDSLAAFVHRIVYESPRSLLELKPGVSADMARLVERCLEKTPGRRFAGATALARALNELGREPAAADGSVAPSRSHPPVTASPRLPDTTRIRSLAVLPLENRSGDPEQEFFVDGMTDALIADLARIGALRVISRTSAMRFKGTRKPLPEIARELKVDAIVEGSALRSGDRVRITVQLIDAASDRSLWSESYERDLVDILTLQSEVARAIAAKIRVHLTPDEQKRLARSAPVNPAAHVAYLRGRHVWGQYNVGAFRESLQYYREALDVDPQYALAWAGIADSYEALANKNLVPPGEGYPKAREAALKGLAIDESRAELHATLAYVSRFHDWDWAEAERGFLHALELNPGYAYGRARYANLLSGLGRHAEAIAEAERALEFDPQSLVVHVAVGDVLFYAREYERSMDYYRRSLEIDPNFDSGHTDLARSLEHVGRYNEALAEFLVAQSGRDGQPPPSTGLAIYYTRVGRQPEAEAVIGRLLELSRRQFVSPYGLASYYAVTGENERALDWLERAYAQRDGTLVWIKVHPRLDGLRSEPRFREILSKMKLDQ